MVFAGTAELADGRSKVRTLAKIVDITLSPRATSDSLRPPTGMQSLERVSIENTMVAPFAKAGRHGFVQGVGQVDRGGVGLVEGLAVLAQHGVAGR
jgi:hypothetical protein